MEKKKVYQYQDQVKGSLLKSATDSLLQRKETFCSIDNGFSFTIKYKDGKEFKGVNVGSFYEYSYLSKIVGFDVKERLEKGLYVPKNTDKDRGNVNTVLFNPENIIKNCHGIECRAIDISKCYITTAKIIGAISVETYNKLMAKSKLKGKDFRVAMSSAIGSLGGISMVRDYIDGKLVDIKANRRDTNVVRLDIIDYVWQIANEIIKMVSEGFLMFLTDCFYILPEYEKFVCDRLAELGYEFKCEKAWFEKVENVVFGGNEIYKVFFIKEANLEKFKLGERPNEVSTMSFGVKNIWNGRN